MLRASCTFYFVVFATLFVFVFKPCLPSVRCLSVLPFSDLSSIFLIKKLALDVFSTNVMAMVTALKAAMGMAMVTSVAIGMVYPRWRQ